MQSSYAVKWQEPSGHVFVGRLELEPSTLRLSGRNGDEGTVEREIDYADLGGLRIGRAADERLDGGPSLVIERVGGNYLLTSAAMKAGILQELIHEISDLQLKAPRQVTVILPLKEGAYSRVRELALAGPPFDPSQTALTSHQLLLTAEEAIFTFETASADGLESLLSQLDVWAAATAWHELVAGPPRLAEVVYSWHRPDGASHAALGLVL